MPLLTNAVSGSGDSLAGSGAVLSESLLSDTEVLPLSGRTMRSPFTMLGRVCEIPSFLQSSRARGARRAQDRCWVSNGALLW